MKNVSTPKHNSKQVIFCAAKPLLHPGYVLAGHSNMRERILAYTLIYNIFY